MANAEQAAAPAQDAPGKKRKVMLVAGVMLLLLGGVGSFLFLSGGGEATAEVEAEPTPEEGAIVDVAEMTANVGGGGVHYARIAFAAVLDANADQAAVEARFGLLKDATITELGASDADVLRTPAGQDDLRARLSGRAGTIFPDGEVLRIVLTELVVQ